jgi:flavin reductase (DIM6/NTAB) family NADH-FMN oxidoreductase RutF
VSAAPLVRQTGTDCGSEAVPETFRLAMRQLASTVTVITASANGIEAAMTATSVCSVSVEPPQVLVCVNRGGRTHELIVASGRFAVNVLTPQHSGLARHYSAANRSVGRLTLGRWLRSSASPPLLADALVAFGCEVEQEVTAATHTVFIGRLVHLSYREAQPLIYRHGAFGQFSEIQPETAHDVLDY